jgi:Family of unknown function (DUF6364)
MRTIKFYAYICGVKERLNLTIDGALLEAMKAYAASKEMSVSELVESYFRSVTKPVGRDNILDLVDRLPLPEERGEQKFAKCELLPVEKGGEAQVGVEGVKKTAELQTAREEQVIAGAGKEGGGYGF